MTEGKKFEHDFKSSVPKDVWYYRFKDGTANFAGGTNENVRFQAKNICDCELFFMPNLFLLELKSTMQKNLPLGMVRANQIKDLTTASFHEGIVAGFVVNFRSIGETYFMTIGVFNQFVELEDRKSIPIEYFRQRGKLIRQEKKRVRFKYALKEFITNFSQKDNLVQRDLFNQK